MVGNPSTSSLLWMRYYSPLYTRTAYCYTKDSTLTLYLTENTHLLCKGKYHCTADLVLDRLGFGQTSKSVYSFNSTKQLNPNQSNRRSAIQWYFPLQSEWVFSVFTMSCDEMYVKIGKELTWVSRFKMEIYLPRCNQPIPRLRECF